METHCRGKREKKRYKFGFSEKGIFRNPIFPPTEHRACCFHFCLVWLYAVLRTQTQQGSPENSKAFESWARCSLCVSSTSKPWPCFSLCSLESWGLPALGCACVAISRTNTYQDRPLLLIKKQSYPQALDYLRAQGLKATRKVQHGDCWGRNWPEAHTSWTGKSLLFCNCDPVMNSDVVSD